MGDGSCPACRKNTQQEPASTPERDTEATREAAWDRYQESLRQPSIEPAIASLRQAEKQFGELRTTAVARLQAGTDADSATSDRIQQELLPHFAATVKQLKLEGEPVGQTDRATSGLIEYVKMRQQSWQFLAAALLESDTKKLQRHIELWEESEKLIVGIVAESQSLAKPTPLQRVRAFQQALVTFTPRVIVTPALVIANVLVFVAMVATGVHFFAPTAQSVANWGANFGPKTMDGQWWRLVTCMFLHYGILHLAFNMWILWDLGRLVERLVGNIGFAVLYFVSGIAGSIASLAWNPTVVSAGASGAVFGVAGALLGLIAFRRDTVPAAVLKQLRNSIVAFVLYNVFYGMTATGIDMAAHIGGLVAGFVCGLILSQPLSVEMVARRRVRNAVVAVIGAIALPLAAFALPDAPLDIDREMQHFAEMEQRAIDINNDLARRSQRGEVSDADFARTVEREILPLWIEARKKIEGLLDVPYADRAYLSRLVEYMRCREESWQLRVEGIREQDAAKIEQANQKGAAADEMASRLASP
jgi:rhomboid protease GluP